MFSLVGLSSHSYILKKDVLSFTWWKNKKDLWITLIFYSLHSCKLGVLPLFCFGCVCVCVCSFLCLHKSMWMLRRSLSTWSPSQTEQHKHCYGQSSSEVSWMFLCPVRIIGSLCFSFTSGSSWGTVTSWKMFFVFVILQMRVTLVPPWYFNVFVPVGWFCASGCYISMVNGLK